MNWLFKLWLRARNRRTDRPAGKLGDPLPPEKRREILRRVEVELRPVQPRNAPASSAADEPR